MCVNVVNKVIAYLLHQSTRTFKGRHNMQA